MNLSTGLDLGQQRDFSALVIAERVHVITPFDESKFDRDQERPDGSYWHDGRLVYDTYHVRHIQTWRLGTPYPAVVDDVCELYQRDVDMRHAPLTLDRTGVGAAVADAFLEAWQAGKLGAVRPVPVTITAGFSAKGGVHGWGGASAHKGDLVGRLLMLFERDRIKWAPGLPQVDALVKQLRGFTLKQNQKTGNLTYEAATEAVHDDLVIALALAVWWPHRKTLPRYVDETGELREHSAEIATNP